MSFRYAGVHTFATHRDGAACVHTDRRGHLCFFTEIQPVLEALPRTGLSPFLGRSTRLSESLLFPVRTHVKKKKSFKVRLMFSSVALLDSRSRHAAPSSTKKAAGLHEQQQSMKWKKKTKNGWFTHYARALAPLFPVQPWWFLHLGILNPCLFCVMDIWSSNLFQTGSCTVTSLGAVFFWDPTCCLLPSLFHPSPACW